ncbi:uncharacterized protein [Gossypium hirsutum]|uniref:Uncharacterized protein n=1 Tax=Gossypium hirsutum TaxID=3635 RepID=A0ABM3AI19_GOSHI|nr:uncharacterized protein LOC121219887 [Gossypium hirsutum]
MQAMHDAPMHANVVEASPAVAVIESALRSRRDGRSFSGLSGRRFRSRVQCQICSRYGHLAQRCFYRFNRDYGGPSKFTPTRFRFGHSDQIHRLEGESSSWGPSGVGYRVSNWKNPNYFAANHNWSPTDPQMMGGPYVQLYSGRAYETKLGRGFGHDMEHGFGSVFGHNVQHSFGPYFGCDEQHEFGHNLGQQQFDPNAAVPRQTISSQPFGLHNSNGPRDGQVNVGRHFTQNSSEPNANYVGFDNSRQHNETSSWYPDSGVIHHVCQDASRLNTTTSYSGTYSLIIGN